MRVLSNAPDPRLGGPLKRSLAVARELRSHGVETVFQVPRGDESFVDRAEADGFECLRLDQPRIRSPRRIRANAMFLAGFRRCVRETRANVEATGADVVHVNGPLNYAVALAAARSDAALLWHFNDTLTPTPLRQLSGHLAARWADERVVAADAVHRYFFDESVDSRTIYAPVDLDHFDPSNYEDAERDVRTEFDIPEGRRVIGTVGNVNPAKGYRDLVESFASVGDRLDAHLLVVGRVLESRREYHEQLQRRVEELGADSRVTFTEWRSDVPRLLGTFDLFVLASVTEACPMVVLEAMAIESPVVTTDVGGVPEQIPDSDHGWTVPPSDPDALAAAMERALSSEQERKRRAEHARQRVERVFSLDQCVADHLAAYRSIA